jgi:hypothetical protein
MIGLESAARPSVSLFELNAEQIFDFVESAIFHAGLTAILCELERYDGIRRNRRLRFKTGAR